MPENRRVKRAIRWVFLAKRFEFETIVYTIVNIRIQRDIPASEPARQNATLHSETCQGFRNTEGISQAGATYRERKGNC